MAACCHNPNHYFVDPGDRLSKIAHENGLDVQAIWDHPENAELRKKRGHSEILMPGDRVFVPDKKPEKLSAEPQAENHYEVQALPGEIDVRLTAGGDPIPAGKEYEIFIDGQSQGKLTTKDGGSVQFYVEPDVTLITLRFADPALECELLVGHLDPLDEGGGLEQRLDNLGYACPLRPPALPSGSRAEREALEANARLREAAIARFQEDVGLPITGLLDDATRAKLDDGMHGG